MARKRITRRDPEEELSKFLRHEPGQGQETRKLSSQLTSLKKERRRGLLTRLGSIMAVCLLAIAFLTYYVSPLADVSTVRVLGADDLDGKSMVEVAQIKASDKVVDVLRGQKKISKKLAAKYPEVASVTLSVRGLNTLNMQVHERKVSGYIKDGSSYREILANGELGTKSLAWREVDHDKPLFISYSKQVALKTNFKIFNSFPEYFKKQVKMLSGNTRRKTQMILVMKDGNVIIGNTETIKSKVKYYNSIKQDLTTNSVIDMEVGAFTRPLTSAEKKAYGLS
ncbi:cell division protein FtsQ/DivIB [Lactobacillus delbrueckii subsp. bulgaricus]|nr:cell division protein FtsQ [Lactobacillus delbrueckii subsp. bulgaricus]MBT8917678.1 cell division protein FtsQ [Lactobacillus delbrueckii subsp. bulgaricus]MBT8920751.1 cell division protein FtsQ [Lactobacillus delbrueckii subsp. bulgaricus]MBT8928297.1 cell division protein FtsQ [Lactobacillus delbrueckii subsp. bulgaricus]MBT8939262.1 cell division protein FtsQ [Lactobacillus delbrueckii subsp. bulgaricus]